MATQQSLSLNVVVVAINYGPTMSEVTLGIDDPIINRRIGVIGIRIPTEIAQNLGTNQSVGVGAGAPPAPFAVGSVEVQGVLASSLPAHTAGNITTNPFPAAAAFQVAPQYMGSQVGALTAKFYARHVGVDTHIADTTVGATGLIQTVNLSTNVGASGDSIVIKLIDVAGNEIGLDSVLPS